MDIVVIGAGSVGLLLSSFLKEQFQNVKLIVRRHNQFVKLQEFGINRKNLDGTSVMSRIEVGTNLSTIQKDTLIIVTVKYGQLHEVYKTLQRVNSDIPILFLQNGLAHFEEVMELPQKTIYFGSCQFGAEKENDYTVAHRGKGIVKVAVGRGTRQYLDVLMNNKSSDLQLKYEDSAEEMLFEKALLNCFINPLTAILNIKNGELIKNQHTYELLARLYNELMEAFPEERARFPFEEIKKLCRNTATNTSSMLSDRLHNRPTEVKTILGPIIKKAQNRGKELNILSTLYHLLLASEKNGEAK